MKIATARLLKSHPHCCFCGGVEPATTRDHQPPRILFPNRHRPEGFEFPACSFCNKQTSADEALVALLARVAGGHRSPQGLRDKALGKAINAVSHSFPGLLPRIAQRVWVRKNGILRKSLGLNGNDPVVDSAVCRATAKLASAAYYHCYGVAVGKEASINTFWTQNQNSAVVRRVLRVLDMMPRTEYLRQGRDWDTQETFFLRYHTENSELLMVAVLHESLALFAQIKNVAPSERWMRVWKPVKGRGMQPY